MERYALEEVMSGIDDGCLWVTLGFSSKRATNDVLHVVCAKTVDPTSRACGMANLFLERLDQDESCYSATVAVVATPTGVTIRLNKKDAKPLLFKAGLLSFQAPPRLPGYADALKILKQMSAMECGRRIRVERPPSKKPLKRTVGRGQPPAGERQRVRRTHQG
jgi:hypothetical protein